MTKRLFNICRVALLAGALTTVACLNKGEETIMLNGGNTAIPSEDEAEDSPDVGDDYNIRIPGINPILEYEGKDIVVRFDMSGILKPNSTKEYMYLLGTGNPEQNVWLDLDGKPKGFVVYNASDGQIGAKLKNDFVFLIDNSGSMDDEANAVAREIVDWAANLSAELDIRFAIVGYDGLITGAIDFTTFESIDAYLNRPGITGVDRTVGFVGERAEELKASTQPYDGKAATECSMAALWYAHENLSFRQGANRIYVNFTDEPNSVTHNEPRFSVEYLASADNWDPSYGTIHTVFSDESEIEATERTVLMSEYTGGTVMTAPSDFSGVTLNDLPVTGAMQHSYIFKFRAERDNRTHDVKVTIYDDNGNIRAVKNFDIDFANIKL